MSGRGFATADRAGPGTGKAVGERADRSPGERTPGEPARRGQDQGVGDEAALLVADGEPPKLALVATMRKMLVTLDAMARTDQPWREGIA